MEKFKKNLIVVLGPTASGKSELAVRLAKKFKGEIVSADSRQVYKKMDIGTGKITKKQMSGIAHYLLDVVSPKKRFTVAEYQKLATKAIDKIIKKNKIPILCGGTGFYIQSIAGGIIIPEVKPDRKLRKELEKKTTAELFAKLKKIDPKRAKTIEKKNKRRLIRALEIVIKTKKPVASHKKSPLPYSVLMIGIKKEKLETLIEKRFLKWLNQGFLKEVEKLKQSGLSWKRIEEFGMHYRTTSQCLQKKISYRNFIEKSIIELQRYAKRQMTWFKRDKKINWIKNHKEAEKLAREFLRK